MALHGLTQGPGEGSSVKEIDLLAALRERFSTGEDIAAEGASVNEERLPLMGDTALVGGEKGLILWIRFGLHIVILFLLCLLLY